MKTLWKITNFKKSWDTNFLYHWQIVLTTAVNGKLSLQEHSIKWKNLVRALMTQN